MNNQTTIKYLFTRLDRYEPAQQDLAKARVLLSMIERHNKAVRKFSKGDKMPETLRQHASDLNVEIYRIMRALEEHNAQMSYEQIASLNKDVIKRAQAASAPLASAGAGAFPLAGFSASVWLSSAKGGAAYTSALASLGGGSLAAGGFGMAGGMCVLAALAMLGSACGCMLAEYLVKKTLNS